MAPTPIIFPPSSAPGTRPQESGGRLINAFAEKAMVGAPSQVIHRRSPGLQRVANAVGFVHTRGFLDINGEALWAVNDRLLKFNSAFAITDIGLLAGTEPVTMARNNAGPLPHNAAVTEFGCFQLLSGSPPIAFPSGGGLPTNPTSICDYNGYFVWSIGDGRIFASDLNSMNVNPFSFNTEHGLLGRRVVRYAGRLYYFGDKWTGVYRDVGTTPFPFAREVTVPRGIVGPHAVAGWESGWANELIWAGDDFVVYRLEGYTPKPVSTDDVSRAIQLAVLAGERNLIEAYVYMYGKNAFWVLSCHHRFTWEYNLTTGEWNERISYVQPCWKGMKSVRIFDEWIIGDQFSGELYRISGSYFQEGLDPLIWHVESGALVNFPMGMVIPRASFNCTTGVGGYVGSTVADPVIEISWSLDGGHTWGLPVHRRLGGPGRSRSHPYILNSGLSKGQGVRYRLRVSDPVHVGLSGGVVDVEVRSHSG